MISHTVILAKTKKQKQKQKRGRKKEEGSVDRVGDI